MVKISLIITCYNNKDLLSSLLPIWTNYSTVCDELIIVDDCSSDGTFQEIKTYFAEHDNITLLELNVNSGRPSMPRNKGISAARNRRVVFCDADDVIPLSYFKFIGSLSYNDSNIYSLGRLNTQELLPDWNGVVGEKYKFIKIPKKVLKFKNVICFSGSSVTLETAQKYRFENTYFEDWIFWKEISEMEDVHFFRSTNASILYYSKITLSPKKTEQFKRVIKHAGVLSLPFYVILSLALIVAEKINRVSQSKKLNRV